MSIEKKTTRSQAVENTQKSAKGKKDKYLEAVGRRKTAVARVRFFEKGDGSIVINENDYKKYFPTLELQQIVESALDKMKVGKSKISVFVKGGGAHAQSEAVRHGISRALVMLNEDFKKRLRKAGYLTRDSRVRERKKFGLKRARKAAQWSKR